jgi:hypothetical protein
MCTGSQPACDRTAVSRSGTIDPADADTRRRCLAPARSSSATKASPGDFESFIRDELGAHLLRPDRRDEPARHGKLAHTRQRIESIIDTLKRQLSLEDHGGRTLAGAYARVAARLLAMATAIWHNHKTNVPVKRSLIAYDH